jgi:hypothetical protein
LPAGFFEIYSQTGLLRHWNSSFLLPCGLVNRRTSTCWILTWTWSGACERPSASRRRPLPLSFARSFGTKFSRPSGLRPSGRRGS